MANENQRITYVFYKDWSEIIEAMPPEMELQVRRAIDEYAFNDNEIELPLAAKFFFMSIKKDIDRDRAKFIEVKKKRKEAINKRWNNQKHSKNTNEYKSIQTNTNDTENENEYENVNENENGLQDTDVSMCNNSLSNESELNNIALAPTLESVLKYIEEKGLNVDGQQFFQTYQATGWVTKGGTPIKDWKAQVMTWTRNGHGNKSAESKKTEPKKDSYSSKAYEETKKDLKRQEEATSEAISYEEFRRRQKK